MKRIILIPALFTAITSFAQTQCSTDNALFKFDNAGSTPREITKLGTAPEFPFMRNMTSAKQFAAALKRNDDRNTAGMTELNNMLMNIGFLGGAKDVNESNISMYYLPPGTEGNMGSANYTIAYSRLSGSADEFKAWKITSGTGCYMYLMAKCGNAFFPKTTNKTACINVPVNLTGDNKEVTLSSSGQKVTTTDNVYVYYHKKRHMKKAKTVDGLADVNPSTPLLVSTVSDVQMVPQTYRLSVNTPENSVNVCPDSALNLTANINVEKLSGYSGYYPASKTEYKKVSKHAYKTSERKMRKIERKEAKVARRTGVKVSQCAVASR